MKRTTFFIAALMALSLASCRKDESLVSPDMGNAIGFTSYMERSHTKAAVTDVTAANLSTFNVMSYLHGTSNGYFMSEQTATKQTSGDYKDTYTTTATYYWPTTSGLDFFAYSGTGSGTVSNTDGVASVSYTVPASGTEDFVVAKAENCLKDDALSAAGTKAQPLTFGHALTKVNRVILNARTDGVSNTSGYKYIFTDVSIRGAKTNATYTFNPASGTNWGTATGSADYIFTEHSGIFLGNTADTLEHSAGVKDQFIILPQTATFSISYAVQYHPAGTDLWIEVMDTVTKTAQITMEMGKAYDITFQLSNDASQLIFSVSDVEDWTTETHAAHFPKRTSSGITWITGQVSGRRC